MRIPVIASVLVLGVVASSEPLHGQTATSDSVAIHRVLAEYVEGWRAGDVPRLRSVFAPAGAILWQSADTLATMTFERALANRRPNPGYGEPWRLESLSIVDGTVASARLWIKHRTGAYVDILGLYKLQDGWRIVTKTYASRPGG